VMRQLVEERMVPLTLAGLGQAIQWLNKK